MGIITLLAAETECQGDQNIIVYIFIYEIGQHAVEIFCTATCLCFHFNVLKCLI